MSRPKAAEREAIRSATIRSLKSRIDELEQQLEAAKDEYEAKLKERSATDGPPLDVMHALYRITAIPVANSTIAGVTDDLVIITRWLLGRLVVDSGKGRGPA